MNNDMDTPRKTASHSEVNTLAPPHGDQPDVVHIVGHIQHWLDRLGLKIPRALCGISLEGDPGKPDLGPDSPVCRRCTEIDEAVR